MRARTYLALILLASVFFISGCKTTLMVRNEPVKQITQIFKDYVGMHGYSITYQNEATGSYHVDMGSVYMPYTSSTQKSSSYIQYNPQGNSGQPMTAYEQTSWNTVSNPSRYAEANAAVNISQLGNDVMIIIDTNDAGGTSLNDISDYLTSLGYKVEGK